MIERILILRIARKGLFRIGNTVDQIVAKLRKANVELGKGEKVPEICRWLNSLLRCSNLLVEFTAIPYLNHLPDTLT